MRRTLLLLSILLAVPGIAVATPHRVRFGIQTGQEGVTWNEVLATWKEAEALGFDSAWTFDHLMPIVGDQDGSCLESWTMLGALAAETQRLRIGVLVTGNGYRNPALLAKMAATVDQISNGRLNLGIGAGWFQPEHDAYGFPFYSAKERAERLGEALEVITKLWTADHPSFSGQYYLLSHAPFAPAPVQKPHPPIIIGGQGRKWILPLVARYADGWNVPIGVSPQGVQRRLEIIRQECQRLGRTNCDIEVSVLLPLISISKIPLAGPITRLAARTRVPRKIARQLLAGSPDDIQAQIQQYVDAGVTHVILYLRPPFDHDLIRSFATDVMPTFRQ
jgi:F420-dependent oxidoreductase-like protein